MVKFGAFPQGSGLLFVVTYVHSTDLKIVEVAMIKRGWNE